MAKDKWHTFSFDITKPWVQLIVLMLGGFLVSVFFYSWMKWVIWPIGFVIWVYYTFFPDDSSLKYYDDSKKDDDEKKKPIWKRI